MNDQQNHPVSLLASSIGWLTAVIVVAAALFAGKPYFYNRGYEEGRSTQAEANIRAVDAIIAGTQIEGENYVVFGKVISTSGSAVVFETLTPLLNNPLRDGARHQTAQIDAQTIIERRTMLPQDQIIRAQEQARSRGLSTQDAVIHKAETITAADLKPGDEIRVYPRVTSDAVKDSFETKQILLVISGQGSSTN